MAAYKWKIPMPVPAEDAANELTRIENSYGRVTPERVLDESRDASAVLHPCFEWDDAKAAEGYRLNQARQLIGNIVITIETPDPKPPQYVRQFVNVAEKPRQAGEYVSINVAMSNPDLRAIVLRNAKNELRMFRRKYETYTELAAEFDPIFKSIDSWLDATPD